ncbi:MAG: efflux RND transporter periplasmic adaptor subunit [Parachlamydia sp.]|nr:efflux RND transporter periplasmic adaptor subunit [Parachlamydia sp.]
MTNSEDSHLPAPEEDEEEVMAEPIRRSYHRYIYIALTALLITGLFLLGYFPRRMQTRKLDQAAKVEEVPVVKTLKVTPDTKEIELVLPSSTDAIRETPIWARTNGYLDRLLVDIGDHVKEGQPLATLDTPEVDQQLHQARADLVSFQAKQEIARISAERWMDLFKHNSEAISAQEVDERKATYNSAIADVISAQANVQRLEKIQGFKVIYAPFDGIITQRDIDIGSLISAGSNGAPQELFKIAKTDVIRVFVNVPQPFFRSIQDGLSADVIIREFPGRIFPGFVARTAKALDPIARTLLTEVHVENKNGEILTGLYAEVRFNLKSDKKRFIVPTEALIIRSGAPQIAILDSKDTVHLKTVKIGNDMGSKIEIVDGLQDGDIIVVNPTEKIREGVQVKVAKS